MQHPLITLQHHCRLLHALLSPCPGLLVAGGRPCCLHSTAAPSVVARRSECSHLRHAAGYLVISRYIYRYLDNVISNIISDNCSGYTMKPRGLSCVQTACCLLVSSIKIQSISWVNIIIDCNPSSELHFVLHL